MVPQSLIDMALSVCALTFMYVSARSVGDDEYKRDFPTPLIEDLLGRRGTKKTYASNTR